MPQYIGFSTQKANKPRSTNQQPGYQGGYGGVTDNLNTGKKFRLTDIPLVVQDLINVLNIRQGEKVGQPDYGTTIWSYVFEPNIQNVQLALEAEIRRIASSDPRLNVNYVKCFPQDNGILLEVQLSVLPFQQTELLSIFFDSNSNNASLI